MTRLAGLAAIVLVAGTAVTSTGSATSAPAPPPGTVHTVTLVTGDVVTVSDDGNHVSAQAGPDREGITFDVTTADGSVRVVPSDAGPLLAAGRLDARLFDVTGLVAAGYHRTEELPVIVTGAGMAAVSDVDGLARTRDLPVVNGVAVRQSRAEAVESWRALTGVGTVWLDGMRQPTVDTSVPQVGAPTAWEAGYTGTGTTVAVLDSGIDDTHPDLAGQIVGRQNFTEGWEPDADLTGHGTHVAATIAGSGERYRGVAPGTTLLDGKVCVTIGCAESWILAGMTWAAAEQGADVVNLSLGAQDDPDVVDPIEEAVQTLSDQYGTLFVIAAGNTDGAVVDGAISSPGSADAALTVGAVNDDDAVADFSRRGPTADGRLKPDITAPGVDITAARGKDATRVPGNQGEPYTTLSGTSMATPHVAGAAAILAQQHPDWSGQRLKTALMAAAQVNPAYGVQAQGAGRLDVARAVGQDMTATPGSVSFGEQLWPHEDDPVQSREVTYHNDGSAAVSLALELTDDSLPAGMFAVGADSVVVPSGGDATVTVTVDTRVAGPDGYLGGWLTATGPDQVLRTPVAVSKEVESYDVTLTHLDRAGATPRSFGTTLSRRDSPLQFGQGGPNPDGTVTLRVPAGHYTLTSVIDTASGEKDTVATLLARPELTVDRALTVDLDARLGQPVAVTVPAASAKQVFAEVAAYTKRPQGTAGRIVLSDSFASVYTVRLGPDTEDDSFFSVVAGQWARADAAGGTDDSPYLYSLLFPEFGRMVHGYQRTVKHRELATVNLDVATGQTGGRGELFVATGSTDLDVGFFGPPLGFRLPFARTEYYNAEAGAASISQFTESFEDGQIAGSESSYTRYQAGRTYRQRWNVGVFAPTLPVDSLGFWLGVVREGDRMVIDVPPFGDGTGRTGAGTTTASAATLFRDGTKIGETDGSRYGSILVPPDEAEYRLELHTERGAPWALSTRVDTAWTFRSGKVASAKLPLWTVRFSPNVDRHNTVRAGGVRAVPVTVTPQPGASVGTEVSTTVEASFDDGATWRSVRVVDGAALVPHPAGSGFVSLRAKAADSAGNTVAQTVIHAYRYG